MSLLGGTTECHDVQVPQAGTAVAFRIAGSHDATGAWIGRPTSSVDGNFEIRLAVSTGPVGSNAAPLRPFDIVIRGTVTGFAIDSYAYTPTSVPSGTTANFSSTFSISGIARYPNFTFADGLGDSALVFSRNSVTATCPAGQVGWTLNGPGSF
jgi:hypothetical protein